MVLGATVSAFYYHLLVALSCKAERKCMLICSHVHSHLHACPHLQSPFTCRPSAMIGWCMAGWLRPVRHATHHKISACRMPSAVTDACLLSYMFMQLISHIRYLYWICMFMHKRMESSSIMHNFCIMHARTDRWMRGQPLD
jgi:hypothetical protein